MDAIVEGNGPVLVLVPGLGCDERLWRPVGQLLAPEWRVVYPRVWGAGSLREAAARIVGVLDELGAPSAFVAGLSMGGYITFELLRHWPRRVAAAALVDTTAFGDTPERRAKREQVLELIRRGAFDQVLRTFAASVLAPYHLGGPLEDLVVEMGTAVGPEAFARDVAAIRDRGSYEDVLERCDRPLLFLAGADDALTPPEVAREMAARARNGRWARVSRAGHLAPLENPDETAKHLREFFSTCAPEEESA